RRMNQGPKLSTGGQNLLGNAAPFAVSSNSNHELIAVDKSQKRVLNGSENDATGVLGVRVIVEKPDYSFAGCPGNIGHDTARAAASDDDEGPIRRCHAPRLS